MLYDAELEVTERKQTYNKTKIDVGKNEMYILSYLNP